jgi:NADH dehydrogenase
VTATAPVELVTGAFSYSGSYIARRLLDAGRRVRTLSFHPCRPHPLQASVEALPYRFDDPAALARSLDGVSTLYNTYWVRFDHGQTRFTQAIERSAALFAAAQQAGVARIVHLSITNPSIGSPLPYFRGKALVEDALARAGVPYSIVRPTWIFGGDHDVLVNNIAWILRHAPIFAVPGSGAYPVQPVHVEDLARICTQAGQAGENIVIDAAGPENHAVREARSTDPRRGRRPGDHPPWAPARHGRGGPGARTATARCRSHSRRDRRPNGRTAGLG